MPRKGRDLEKLVEILERCLQGTGVTITSPDTVLGIISKVPREVDVTLRRSETQKRESIKAAQARANGVAFASRFVLDT